MLQGLAPRGLEIKDGPHRHTCGATMGPRQVRAGKLLPGVGTNAHAVVEQSLAAAAAVQKLWIAGCANVFVLEPAFQDGAASGADRVLVFLAVAVACGNRSACGAGAFRADIAGFHRLIHGLPRFPCQGLVFDKRLEKRRFP